MKHGVVGKSGTKLAMACLVAAGMLATVSSHGEVTNEYRAGNVIDETNMESVPTMFPDANRYSRALNVISQAIFESDASDSNFNDYYNNLDADPRLPHKVSDALTALEVVQRDLTKADTPVPPSLVTATFDAFMSGPPKDGQNAIGGISRASVIWDVDDLYDVSGTPASIGALYGHVGQAAFSDLAVPGNPYFAGRAGRMVGLGSFISLDSVTGSYADPNIKVVETAVGVDVSISNGFDSNAAGTPLNVYAGDIIGLNAAYRHTDSIYSSWTTVNSFKGINIELPRWSEGLGSGNEVLTDTFHHFDEGAFGVYIEGREVDSNPTDYIGLYTGATAVIDARLVTTDKPGFVDNGALLVEGSLFVHTGSSNLSILNGIFNRGQGMGLSGSTPPIDGQRLTVLNTGSGSISFGLTSESNYFFHDSSVTLNQADTIEFVAHGGIWYQTSYSNNHMP